MAVVTKKKDISKGIKPFLPGKRHFRTSQALVLCKFS
jgi:hypothetical protein